MIYNFLDNIYLNFLKNNNFNLVNKLNILSRDINLLFKDSNTNIKNIIDKKDKNKIDINDIYNLFEIIKENENQTIYKIIKIHIIGSNKYMIDDLIYLELSSMISIYTKNKNFEYDIIECQPTDIIEKEKILKNYQIFNK